MSDVTVEPLKEKEEKEKKEKKEEKEKKEKIGYDWTWTEDQSIWIADRKTEYLAQKERLRWSKKAQEQLVLKFPDLKNTGEAKEVSSVYSDFIDVP